MITLMTRSVQKEVEPEVGRTLLELAQQHNMDWKFNCRKGTCAKCRCQVIEGMDQLEPITNAEYDRLEPEELEAGYRLACQAVVQGSGSASVQYKPYF
ncbi:2Fe-2S iron-sulfur cluster-binding protein [Paenibacillus sp. KN14-4R]|uniref:2Fe-2S iron-sulfur cluster-binding protein n=1 Tax=Paenibacillus sp. KN14-4R TaxID=3445773 RepID=UPI003F9F2022